MLRINRAIKGVTRAIKGEKGFTLIELMVVIAIIAVLVAIAIPAYMQATDNAKRKTSQANLRTIDGALNVYYAENGAWPTSADPVVLVDEYLKAAPVNPFTQSSSTTDGYELGDTVAGTGPFRKAFDKSGEGVTYP